MIMSTAIRMENIVKTYGETRVLNGLSLSIEEGGSSGCGKTTMLKMVNGLIKPDSGKIMVKDQDLEHADLISLRRSIGYSICFQSVLVKERPTVCIVDKAELKVFDRSIKPVLNTVSIAIIRENLSCIFCSVPKVITISITVTVSTESVINKKVVIFWIVCRHSCIEHWSEISLLVERELEIPSAALPCIFKILIVCKNIVNEQSIGIRIEQCIQIVSILHSFSSL